jgi:hypothetical protein
LRRIAIVIKELHEIVDNDRHPFSPRIRTLRGDPRQAQAGASREPLPPPKVYAPPRAARAEGGAAICDYVHDRLTFSYPDARSTRTAWDGHQEGRRLPRLCPSIDRLVPLHEYPGAVLHRLSRRYRRACFLL